MPHSLTPGGDSSDNIYSADGAVSNRGYFEAYIRRLDLDFESTFVDRDFVDRHGIDQSYSHVRTSSSGDVDDFLNSKATFYVPFVEGLPFAYGVTLTASASISRYLSVYEGRDRSDILVPAPDLTVPGSAAGAYADRSLYFDSAAIVDEDGNEYSLAGLTSSLGIDYTQATAVPEPSTYALFFLGMIAVVCKSSKSRNFASKTIIG